MNQVSRSEQKLPTGDGHSIEKMKWWAWHKKNPMVWELFEKYTYEVIHAGHQHYSHWAVIQRIRWHTDITTRHADFKIPNDYIAYYARLFHALHPKYDGFFRIRPLKSERLRQTVTLHE